MDVTWCTPRDSRPEVGRPQQDDLEPRFEKKLLDDKPFEK